MILLTESEEVIWSLPDHHALSDRIMGENNEKPQWKWHMKGVWATNFICHLIFGGHLLNIPKKVVNRKFPDHHQLFKRFSAKGLDLFS